MNADHARVRVRWARGTFITDPLPADEAAQMRLGLRDAVASLGGTYGFVNFDATGGRAISVRARDVVAVELIPESTHQATELARAAQPAPATGTGSGSGSGSGTRTGTVAAGVLSYPPHGVAATPATVTAFLRQQAQRSHQ